jgi:hypothetical protein
METESWQAAKGKILALGTTTTPDHDVLVSGGNDSLVSFWGSRAGSDESNAASARSNGEHAGNSCLMRVLIVIR